MKSILFSGIFLVIALAIMTQGNKMGADPTKVCQKPGFNADPEDCSKFHVCVLDIVGEYTCGVGSAFDPIYEHCDSADNVPGCATNADVAGSNLCVKEGFNRDPQNCTIYYTCELKGNQYACGAGTVFNPVKEVCDFPENVPSCN